MLIKVDTSAHSVSGDYRPELLEKQEYHGGAGSRCQHQSLWLMAGADQGEDTFHSTTSLGQHWNPEL